MMRALAPFAPLFSKSPPAALAAARAPHAAPLPGQEGRAGIRRSGPPEHRRAAGCPHEQSLAAEPQRWRRGRGSSGANASVGAPRLWRSRRRWRVCAGLIGEYGYERAALGHNDHVDHATTRRELVDAIQRSDLSVLAIDLEGDRAKARLLRASRHRGLSPTVGSIRRLAADACGARHPDCPTVALTKPLNAAIRRGGMTRY
jgi:hypothetical protein